MPILSLFACCLALPPLTPQMDQLKASFCSGDQLSLEATTDSRRLFVADGAMITVLDVENLPTPPPPPATPPTPCIVQRIPVPLMQPLTMKYYFHQAALKHSLFIAGGTTGVWRVELCNELFANLTCLDPAQLCTSFAGTDQPIDLVETTTAPYFVRKRCVDIAIVEGNGAGVPLLFALFQAGTQHTPSGFGPSELRAYRLENDGSITPYSTLQMSDPTWSAAHNVMATAIESDPGDSNYLYVAMGTEWLYKVNITTATFGMTKVPVVPIPPAGPIDACRFSTCPAGEQMRDISLVRTATKGAFVYAILDYGRIIEYRLLSGKAVALTLPKGYGERISAVTDGSNKVVVAVGLENQTGHAKDTAAPFWVTGTWNTPCLDAWHGDPNGAIPVAGISEVRFYKRDASIGSSGLVLLPDADGHSDNPDPSNPVFGSVLLRRAANLWRGYVLTNVEATKIYHLKHPFGAYPKQMSQMSGPIPIPDPEIEVSAIYRGDTFAAGDGIVSKLNAGMTYFGVDGLVKSKLAGGMLYITPGPNVEIKPVADTLSVCATSTALLDCNGLKADPNPFVGGFLGTTSWIDPNDPTKEWFMSGVATWINTNPNPTCADDPECGSDPCLTGLRWKKGVLAHAGSPDDKIGWRLVSFFPGTLQPTGLTLGLNWWQLASPRDADDLSRTDSLDYLSTITDPRPTSATDARPLAIYGTRSGSKSGFKVFETSAMLDFDQTSSCPVSERGKGESLDYAQPTSSDVRPFSVRTHIEFDLEECAIWSDCAGTDVQGQVRNLHNPDLDVFTIMDGANERYVSVIAAGYVAAGAAGQGAEPNSCPWDDAGLNYNKRPLIVFYDVTDVPASEPVLLRAGVGFDEGNAWSIKTWKHDGHVYVFVGDILGRLLVFDVSGDTLFSSPSPATLPYLPATTVLRPAAVLEFPIDPCDGNLPNVLDLDIHQDEGLLYCALGRSGIGIVDVAVGVINSSNPPQLIELIDSPGIAEGVCFREPAPGQREMVVGDSRCGMRLYGH